ncbi:MAG: NADH:ubiquinone oxidoreductase subunit NDUFA12 [Neomegalonema sp.]|nr:NADH:ubiquinone oxidoreductase subunit NDUFA12 [Neomegalonema sp.]
MSLFRDLFAWWTGRPLGTRLFTAFKGRFVGEDEYGNKYYETRDSARRWVLYEGNVEASKVPADWHGWLHHTYKQPPTKEPLPKKPWEAAHTPNMTGTDEAYRPKGSPLREGARPRASGDYEAWTPK